MYVRFLDFGKMGAKRIVGFLFWVGAAISAISSILLGKYLYITNTYDKEIMFMQNGQQWFTSRPVNNLPLGIAGGLVSFIVYVLILRAACEVLYLVIRCMETYLEKNRGTE